MGFTPDFLDEIRNRLPASEIVGRKVRLVRKGREFTGLCPFHNEKTPSFTVNDEKGIYCLVWKVNCYNRGTYALIKFTKFDDWNCFWSSRILFWCKFLSLILPLSCRIPYPRENDASMEKSKCKICTKTKFASSKKIPNHQIL